MLDKSSLIIQVFRQYWPLSLLFLLFLPLLLRLGFWQLERAQEKHQHLTVYQQQHLLPAKPFDTQINSTHINYQKVYVDGQYDTRYWLLDNRSRSGKAGYEVVSPVKVGQSWLLVNRGWIAASPKRDQLPEILTPIESVRLQGYLHRPSQNVVIKQAGSDLLVDWPKRVLYIDTQAASTAINGEVFPMHLRLDEDSPGALLTDWKIINTQPEKHQAYAVQWFSMAFALCVLFAWFVKRSIRENDERKSQ